MLPLLLTSSLSKLLKKIINFTRTCCHRKPAPGVGPGICCQGLEMPRNHCDTAGLGPGPGGIEGSTEPWGAQLPGEQLSLLGGSISPGCPWQRMPNTTMEILLENTNSQPAKRLPSLQRRCQEKDGVGGRARWWDGATLS